MKGQRKPPIVVYFNGTFVYLENGAHARLSDMVTFLDKHFDDVTLYSYSNHVNCPWTAGAIEKFKLGFPRVKLCLEAYTRPLRWLTRLKNLLLSIFPQHGPAILQMRLPGATPRYRRMQGQMQDAVWIVNYADGMTQLNGLPSARRIVVETHDLKFVLASKVANTSPTSVRNLIKLRTEVTALGCASSVIAISPPESEVFKLLTPSKMHFYIPAYFKIEERTSEICSLESDLKYDLLFVASGSEFNIQGIKDFVESNATWLFKYKISVCGLICKNSQIIQLVKKYDNVYLLGYIEDLSAIYKSSKAVISPTDGTGLKIKVVEALLRGKPVFGSAHTRDGLPGGYENCVFPIERTIMETILNMPEKRRTAEHAAFSYLRTLDLFNEIDTFLDYLKCPAGSL